MSIPTTASISGSCKMSANAGKRRCGSRVRSGNESVAFALWARGVNVPAASAASYAAHAPSMRSRAKNLGKITKPSRTQEWAMRAAAIESRPAASSSSIRSAASGRSSHGTGPAAGNSSRRKYGRVAGSTAI
jgi:hypothetical protein